MNITIKPANSPESDIEVNLVLCSTAMATGWADGALIWQRSAKYQQLLDVRPPGAEEPYADGGTLFCRAWTVPEKRGTEDLALDRLAKRLTSETVTTNETWTDSGNPWVWVEWSDGVNNIISGIIRISDHVMVELEYCIHVFRDPGWATYASEGGSAPRRFIRAITLVDSPDRE